MIVREVKCTAVTVCAYCGNETPDDVGRICRDGAGVGPDVPLCLRCQDDDGPTPEQIWERIAEPSDEPRAWRPKVLQ